MTIDRRSLVIAVVALPLAIDELRSSGGGGNQPAGAAPPEPGQLPYPVYATMPAATKTWSPHADAAKTPRGSAFETAGAGLAVGDVVALRPGDYNPNFLGFERVASLGYGGGIPFQLNAPGGPDSRPVVIRPAAVDTTTLGRVYVAGSGHVVFLNQRFADRNRMTPVLMRRPPEGGGQIPHLLIQTGANTIELRCCHVHGPDDSQDGMDVPHAFAWDEPAGPTAELRIVDSFCQGLRQWLCGGRVIARRSWFHQPWDQQLYMQRGRGTVIEDCLFSEPRGHAGDSPDPAQNAHVDYLHFAAQNSPAPRTLGDTVRRCVFVKGGTAQAKMAVAIQDTHSGAPGSPPTSSHNRENLLIVNGQQDDFKAHRIVQSSFSRNTIITDQSEYRRDFYPWIRMHGCEGVRVEKNIVEGINDLVGEYGQERNSPANLNLIRDNVFLDRTLTRGSRRMFTGYLEDVRGWPAGDLFFDPRWGRDPVALIRSERFDRHIIGGAIATDLRQAWMHAWRYCFRPKLDGPAKLADGSYAGALTPDGKWNTGAPYAGGSDFQPD